VFKLYSRGSGVSHKVPAVTSKKKWRDKEAVTPRAARPPSDHAVIRWPWKPELAIPSATT
jgi:hypothetical protein